MVVLQLHRITYNDSVVVLVKLLANLLAQLALRQAKIVTGVALVVHERDESIIGDIDELETNKLEVSTLC